jgi:DNA gyrase subunit A
VKQKGIGAFVLFPAKRKTAELCLEAIKLEGWALKYVPAQLKTAELCLEAVKQNGKALEYVPNELKILELCLEAVKQNGWAIEYVPEKLKTVELCRVAIDLPDVRDGLIPIHRRILYFMNEMGLHFNQTSRKSSRIVREISECTPHGDDYIYDSLILLTQFTSMRYPMLKGQGYLGSIGYPAADMDYTEARMSRLAGEMVKDIDKETVDFIPNHDKSLMEPSVLPAAVPCLLVNGSPGIVTGIATNIPPHNLKEVCAAITAYIDDPNIDVKGLMKHISGPDFPTAGIIYGRKGIVDAYTTGRGRINVRARYAIESKKGGGHTIVITELPYMVGSMEIFENLKCLKKNKELGMSGVRDDSRNGAHIVINLKKDISPKAIMDYLFAHTRLQVNFDLNFLVLVGGKPKTLCLKEIIEHFVAHRREVIIRRTKYDLRKAEERTHVEELKALLASEEKILAVKKAETHKLSILYSDKRRTEIADEEIEDAQNDISMIESEELDSEIFDLDDLKALRLALLANPDPIVEEALRLAFEDMRKDREIDGD